MEIRAGPSSMELTSQTLDTTTKPDFRPDSIPLVMA
jgi:hypothetical protein